MSTAAAHRDLQAELAALREDIRAQAIVIADIDITLAALYRELRNSNHQRLPIPWPPSEE